MRLLILGLAVGLAGGLAAFALSERADAPGTSRTKTVTLVQGDVVDVPHAKTRCAASQEGGSPNLFCTPISGGPLQIVFYADRVLIWDRRKGPDAPVASFRWGAGKP
jgi:hypothetical protein